MEEMTEHQIYLAEDFYSKSGRIALDLVDPSEEELRSISSRLKERAAPLSYSTHCLYTDGANFESVQELDPYFRNAEQVKDINEFISRLERNAVLTASKAAFVIKELAPECDPLKLQKLLYLCQAEYLMKSGELLFTDDIEAWKYGPVVRSVYKTYQVFEDTPIPKRGVSLSVLKRMFASSVNGEDKFRSVQETITKYGSLSAGELVELTHRPGSPWSRTELNHPITREAIISGHPFEDL